MKTKHLPVKLSEIDDADRSFLAVASTESVDRDGDTIRADGWDLSNFLRNPVVPWAHDYRSPPVARATEVRVEGGRLIFRPKFPTADEYPFADTVWKLYRGGFLNAFSVGFSPIRFEIEDRGERGMGRNYLEQELWEISACVVPSNPDAVAVRAAGDNDGGAILASQAQVLGLANILAEKQMEIEDLRDEIRTLEMMEDSPERHGSRGVPSREDVARAVAATVATGLERILDARIRHHLGRV